MSERERLIALHGSKVPGNIDCVQYDERGAIVSTMHLCQEAYDANVKANPRVIKGEGFYSSQYVKDGVILDRPEMECELIDDTLMDVPVPATIVINDKEYESDEDEVELGFDLPGEYTIIVRSWPYKDKIFTFVKE